MNWTVDLSKSVQHRKKGMENMTEGLRHIGYNEKFVWSIYIIPEKYDRENERGIHRKDCWILWNHARRQRPFLCKRYKRLLVSCMCFNLQSDDPAVKWQLNLYKDVLKSEEPSNPEKTVERVQRISAAVFHLEQVNSIYPEAWGSKTALQNTKFLSTLSF